jgi:tRNA(Arg) A34 adenosine deaminase TadA
MNTIRFSILLSLLLFGSYANHTAEQYIKERRLNNMRLVKLKDGMTHENYSFMRSALNIHKSGTEKNGSVQSVSLIVKDGKIIGEGSDKSIYFTDPSAHATMTAVREACRNIGMTSLKGCTLYSTTELCPMCVSLLYVADIDKIIYCIPSDEGPSAEVLMIEKIYGALRQKIGERPIPEIFVPYQMLDSDIHGATDGTEN